jgi:hypothetical protein
MSDFYNFDNSNPERIPVPHRFGTLNIANTMSQIATNLRWCKVLGISPQTVISNPSALFPIVGNLSETFHNNLVRDRISAYALRDSYGKEWFSDDEVSMIEALTGNWNDTKVAK